MTVIESKLNAKSIDELSVVSDVNHHASINAYYDSPEILLFEEMAEQQIHLGYWDDRYPNVSMAQAAQRLTQVVIDQIDVPHEGYLLDIGCGCGQPAIEIVEQKNCYVEGITINPQQKKKAEARSLSHGCAGRASFTVGDAAFLPYADQQFDATLMFESIHHIGHDAALSEAWRVMKPGATILVADGVVLKDQVDTEARNILSDTFVSKSLVTKEQLLRAFRETGFEGVEVLDLSSAIQPTWGKLLRNTTERRESIVSTHDEAFFANLLAFWKQMNEVWSKNARYLLIKARKP